MQEFERLKQFWKRLDPSDTEPRQESTGASITTGKRGGVRDSRGLSLGGFPNLERYKRDVLGRGRLGQCLPCAQISEPFDVKADCSYTIII